LVGGGANEEESHPDTLAIINHSSPSLERSLIAFDSQLNEGIDRERVCDFGAATFLTDFDDTAGNTGVREGLIYFERSDECKARNRAALAEARTCVRRMTHKKFFLDSLKAIAIRENKLKKSQGCLVS
jgi:hypothetical protein